MEGKQKQLYRNRIRQFRMEKGLTQQVLARMMGYQSPSSLSHLERGMKLPSLVTALKLEVALQRFIGDIFPDLYDEIRDHVGKRRRQLFYPDQDKY